MRPFVLVALAASLVGCVSVPYADTSFKAHPQPKHKAPEATEAAEEITPSAMVSTSTAFPDTAQPTGRPPVIESPEHVTPSTVKGEE